MSRTRKIEIAIIAAALMVLAGVWAINGYDDTWLYLTAAIIIVPSSWFYFGRKKDQ